MLPLLLASAALASSPPLYEREVSTEAPSRALRSAVPEPNPWSLELRQDERERALSLNYRIRWDAASLSLRGPGEAPRLAPAGSAFGAGVRDILRGSRLNLYGVRLRPFPDEPWEPPRPASSGTAAGGAPPAGEPRVRWRLGAERAVDRLEENAALKAQRWLIEEAFSRALPRNRSAPYAHKESVYKALREAESSWSDSWEEPARGAAR